MKTQSKRALNLKALLYFPIHGGARKKADVPNCFKCYSYLQYSTSEQSATLSQQSAAVWREHERQGTLTFMMKSSY